MTETHDEDFDSSTKFWICDNTYVNGDVKVKGQFPVTKKYRAYAHRDCNIKAKLNRKVPLMFHNLKNYDTHFIMQELVNLI